jgi:hypothetical protein
MAQVEALIGIYGLAVRVQGPGSGSVQAMRSEILSDIEKPQPELLFVQPNEPFLASSEDRLLFDAAFGAAAEHKWVDAAKAFRLLAEKGNAVAQCAMGYVCQYDLLIGGVPKELKEPFKVAQESLLFLHRRKAELCSSSWREIQG